MGAERWNDKPLATGREVLHLSEVLQRAIQPGGSS